MSRTLITDIVQLTRDGWRPYGGRPEGYVYERLGCPYQLVSVASRTGSSKAICICASAAPGGAAFPVPKAFRCRFPSATRSLVCRTR